MIKITQLKIPLEGGYDEILSAAAKALKCPKRAIISLEITRKAIDSRKKNNIFLKDLNTSNRSSGAKAL